jgi:hypothetical protein
VSKTVTLFNVVTAAEISQMRRELSALNMVTDRVSDNIMQQPRIRNRALQALYRGVTMYNTPVEYRAVQPAELQPALRGLNGGITVHNIPVVYQAVQPAELQPLAVT